MAARHSVKPDIFAWYNILFESQHFYICHHFHLVNKNFELRLNICTDIGKMLWPILPFFTQKVCKKEFPSFVGVKKFASTHRERPEKIFQYRKFTRCKTNVNVYLKSNISDRLNAKITKHTEKGQISQIWLWPV